MRNTCYLDPLKIPNDCLKVIDVANLKYLLACSNRILSHHF